MRGQKPLDIPEFSHTVEQIGHNPARFLLANSLFAEARIRGIERLHVAGAYQGVARQLHEQGRLDDIEFARYKRLLGNRIAVLEEHGERLPPEEIHAIAEESREAYREQQDDADDGGRDRDRPLSAEEKLSLIRRGEYKPNQRARTDGGDPGAE